MAKPQCRKSLDGKQCVGEEGHPGWHLFGDNVRMSADGRFMSIHADKPKRLQTEYTFDPWSTIAERICEDRRDALDAQVYDVLRSAGKDLFAIDADEAELLAEGYQKQQDGSWTKDFPSQMFTVDDPMPKLGASATWDTKDRCIEWVRTNFTPGMLAKLYKLSYDGDGLRRDKCDELIKKG